MEGGGSSVQRERSSCAKFHLFNSHRLDTSNDRLYLTHYSVLKLDWVVESTAQSAEKVAMAAVAAIVRAFGREQQGSHIVWVKVPQKRRVVDEPTAGHGLCVAPYFPRTNAIVVLDQAKIVFAQNRTVQALGP